MHRSGKTESARVVNPETSLWHFLKNTDPGIYFVPGLHEIPANPMNLQMPKISRRKALANAESKYEGNKYTLGDGTEVTVTGTGLDELAYYCSKEPEDIVVLVNLPEILGNTHIFRKERNANEKKEETSEESNQEYSIMQGVAAAYIDGKPALIRTVFKKDKKKKGNEGKDDGSKVQWNYYTSRVMWLKEEGEVARRGTPKGNSQFRASRRLPRFFPSPSVGSKLYHWIKKSSPSTEVFLLQDSNNTSSPAPPSLSVLSLFSTTAI